MKKLLLMLFSMLILTGCNSKVSESISCSILQSDEPANWQKAYKQVLQDFMKSDEYVEESDEYVQDSSFSLYDINVDEIPELIISPNIAHGTSCSVYTYGNNGLVSLGRIGAFGEIGYYEDNNMIHYSNIGQGIEHIGFYELKNNEIIRLALFFNDVGYSLPGQETYKCNDIELTEDEYNIEIKKYRGNEYISLGRDYSFNEIDEAFIEYYENIGIDNAYRSLRNRLDKIDDIRISYTGRREFDDVKYYVFICNGDFGDQKANMQWYAVDTITGECFDTNGLTELTPII